MLKKYPRTFHLPWSRSRTDDDKILRTVGHFEGKEVVVTEKLDGENTTLYRNHIHARSLDSKDHASRHWVKMLHGTISFHIPEGWRICGENVYALHSIYYEHLTSYFYVFSIWNENNECLSWDETVEWAELLGLETAPVLYRGIWSEETVKSCYTKQSVFGGEQEGYVVRLTERFSYEDFKQSAAKFVRKNHVQTDQHWLSKPVVPNGIAQTT
ncbi:RNA ligase family protein [Brevibacillus formosus]|uniref:2'-5' RNA ligase n=1 Tax=Brevibacillus formosus TaxID=54913 RepID=A0A837KSW3_9BACL|nr:RNA ligase family protein [Brevibacillus formosus]KLI00133.1 2'-5' RNA ligase [Brevibacillus formosus]MBG9946141.1 2'-5' RNA ligase [Brevibacillus formosus]MED1959269.1 RNA ligase family protein [Brevibacillus formosus]PSJ96202.1 2'-5' RNA ligase [Brevibacillus formosus]GED56575.1 2'-5' RNA ligase [Brevibacillus formosus]